MKAVERKHLGAYASIVRHGAIVLIEKARGPYTGLLDLPGGAIEFGETVDAAVVREVREETGLLVATHNLYCADSVLYPYTREGLAHVLHHIGFIYICTVKPGGLSAIGDGQDAAGAAWYALDNIESEHLTPFAQNAVARAMQTLD